MSISRAKGLSSIAYSYASLSCQTKFTEFTFYSVGEKTAEKMKSQLAARKYIQELAIPSVLQNVFKICISHNTVPKSVLSSNSPPPPKKKKNPSTWLATR